MVLVWEERGATSGSKFGYSNAADDAQGIIVVGAPNADYASGTAYVYEELTPNVWTVQAELYTSNTQDTNGCAVAIYGDVIVVGDYWSGSVQRGQTWFYEATSPGSGTWTGGQNTHYMWAVGSDPYDYMARNPQSLGLSATRAFPTTIRRNSYTGAIDVYDVFNTGSEQGILLHSLTPTEVTAGDRFGHGLSVDDSAGAHRIVCSALLYGANDEGAVFIYDETGVGTDLYTYIMIQSTLTKDGVNFGSNSALKGDYLFLQDQYHWNTAPEQDHGRVQMYRFESPNWELEAVLESAYTTTYRLFFGHILEVAPDSDQILVGTNNEGWSSVNASTNNSLHFTAYVSTGNPCLNSSACAYTLDLDAYTCQCAPGMTGSFCDVDLDECQSSPCPGSGICSTPVIASYECDCPNGYTGVNCDEDIDDCQSSPCSYGVCVDDGSVFANFECNCTGSGYSGTFCEEPVNECDSSPCLNNGVCSDLLADYLCNCSTLIGFTGEFCEFDIWAPVFDLCPATFSVPAIGTTVTGIIFPEAQVSDNAAGTVNYTVNATSTTVFTLGEHVLAYVATDSQGNTAIPCLVVFSVVDVTAPQLICPDTLLIAPNSTGVLNVTADVVAAELLMACNFTDNWTTVADLLWQTEALAWTNDSTTALPLGTTVVTVTLTDAAGNNISVLVTVEVADIVPPTIVTCPDAVVFTVDDLLALEGPNGDFLFTTLNGSAIDNSLEQNLTYN
jgi:hypothetical protein